MRIGSISIYREKPGVIGPDACWVCAYGPYLVVHDSLPKLLWYLITHFRDERDYVGCQHMGLTNE